MQKVSAAMRKISFKLQNSNSSPSIKPKAPHAHSLRLSRLGWLLGIGTHRMVHKRLRQSSCPQLASGRHVPCRLARSMHCSCKVIPAPHRPLLSAAEHRAPRAFRAQPQGHSSLALRGHALRGCRASLRTASCNNIAFCNSDLAAGSKAAANLHLDSPHGYHRYLLARLKSLEALYVRHSSSLGLTR